MIINDIIAAEKQTAIALLKYVVFLSTDILERRGLLINAGKDSPDIRCFPRDFVGS